jgi:hypothetical protein
VNYPLTEHLELCAALAVGSLDTGDRRRFAEHLAVGCDECERLLPDYERATVLLAAALPLSAPSAPLRERVLQAAASVRPAPAIVPPPTAQAPAAPQPAAPQPAALPVAPTPVAPAAVAPPVAVTPTVASPPALSPAAAVAPIAPAPAVPAAATPDVPFAPAPAASAPATPSPAAAEPVSPPFTLAIEPPVAKPAVMPAPAATPVMPELVTSTPAMTPMEAAPMVEAPAPRPSPPRLGSPPSSSPDYPPPPPPAPSTYASPAATASTPYRPGVARRQAAPAPPAMWMAISGASILMALLAIGVAWHFAGEAKHAHGDMTGSTQVIAGLNQQLEDAQTWGGLFTLPDTRTATLQSTARSETILRARAIYDPRSQRALLVFNGLRTPDGKAFQLWAIEGPRLTSLGVIKTDEEGRAIVRVEDAGDPNRLTDFGVSLENAGGSSSNTAPSGPMVMIGKIEG